jgi:CTP synthase
LDSYIIEQLGLDAHEVDWNGWSELLHAVHEPKHEVTIGVVGKYIDLPDAYLSVIEALRAGGFANQTKVRLKWIPSDECDNPDGAGRQLSDVDGICVPGGFGIRGIEGKVGALRFARENGIPALGLCLGLQCMVIEFARHEAGLEGASSSEFDPDTVYPVIATMAEQVDIIASGDLGGTMRLGLYPAILDDGSIVSELYGADEASERHRHRYEVNNRYRQRISDAGMWFSGTSPDGHLVEYVELPRDVHPFYVGTQAHPELRSRPNRSHPLFHGLVGAALERQNASLLFEVKEDDESEVA